MGIMTTPPAKAPSSLDAFFSILALLLNMKLKYKDWSSKVVLDKKKTQLLGVKLIFQLSSCWVDSVSCGFGQDGRMGGRGGAGGFWPQIKTQETQMELWLMGLRWKLLSVAESQLLTFKSAATCGSARALRCRVRCVSHACLFFFLFFP